MAGSSFDLNSPLASQIMSQGQALGYSPMALAALVSRTYDENGGNTGGAPGDNGISYGGMQWNGPRYDALQAQAQKMGLPWTDPKVQAAHIFNELGGSEANAGQALQGAQTPEDATAAVMSYVRPKGWNKGYDDINHGDDTLDRTRAIANAISTGQTTGDGGTPLQTGRSVGLDMTPTSSFQGAGTVPGGVPQSFGSQLVNAGAALMARDNPQGAAQLVNLAQAQQKMDLLSSGYGQWEDKGVSPNGKYVMQSNKINGGMRYLPISPDATGLKEKDLQPNPKEEAMSQANENLMSQNAQVIQKANIVRQALADGTLTMSAGEQGQGYIANIMNAPTEQSALIKDAWATINQQAGNILAAEKGTATKSKMAQAYSQILPSGGQWNPVTFSQGMDRVVQSAMDQYRNAASANSSLMTRKPGLASGLPGPDGSPLDAKATVSKYASDLAGFQSADDALRPQLDAMRQRNFARSAGTPAPSFGAFLSKYNSQ